MKKYILISGALVALALPSAAIAAPVDPADGYIWNESALEQEQGNLVGEYTSQITHNGRWVQDQIADKGGRSAVVQSVLAQDGLGRLAK
jgi:hypothetical protein